MIRKVGKRWIYECRNCEVTSVQLDLLRVTEAKNRHQSTWGHIFRPTTIAAQDLARVMFGTPDE